MSGAFRCVEAERTIVFGVGALGGAADLVGEGYVLMTTERALSALKRLKDGAALGIDVRQGEVGNDAGLLGEAASVVYVPPGPVDEVAGRLRGEVAGVLRSAATGEMRGVVGGERLVAFGGGRVIDVAKALAAVEEPCDVVAIPTSLSGAEMTGVHRHVEGAPPDAARVRPAVVVNDPRLSASQPVEALAASSANALGHAIVAVFSDRATPLSEVVGCGAIEKLAGGWSGDEPDRMMLAEGALMAGWAVDRSGLGPHHALTQSAVRTASLEHAQTNAALLPATIGAIRARRPAEMERLERKVGVALEAVAERLRDRAGAGLGALESDRELLERTVEVAARRPELERIEPALDEAEIWAIYRAGGAYGA